MQVRGITWLRWRHSVHRPRGLIEHQCRGLYNLCIGQQSTTSFAITLYGQCCCRHVVGQRAVSDVSVVCSCWSICTCALNLIILISSQWLLTWNVLFHTLDLQHGGVYFVTIDRAFSDLIEPHLFTTDVATLGTPADNAAELGWTSTVKRRWRFAQNKCI